MLICNLYSKYYLRLGIEVPDKSVFNILIETHKNLHRNRFAMQIGSVSGEDIDEPKSQQRFTLRENFGSLIVAVM